MTTYDRFNRIRDAIDNWLQPDNIQLKTAIDRSVEEGLFSFPDIKHQVLTLKKSLNADSLRLWSDRNNLKAGSMNGYKVLCLHAGNLPLAGIQDVLASAITGIQYFGKISRKDPYLLPTFIRELENTAGLKGFNWSTNVNDLKGTDADAVLFSGSSRSVDDVYRLIRKLKLAKHHAEYLIRTAHFSVAYLDRTDSKTMHDLVEAVFRYGGRGCRSVAAVITPFSLDSIKCELTDYIESFWLHNPQHLKPKPALHYRFAYNKAVGHPQSWLEDFLIEQTDVKPEQDFVLHWVHGGENQLIEYAQKNQTGLQAVYSVEGKTYTENFRIQTEKLEDAQAPPIYWKPDGVDTLEWLNEKYHRSQSIS